MGLTLEMVKGKIKKIEKIECNEIRPTYKQLDELSNLYQVPRWVFISQEIPEEYQFKQKPSFRIFKDSPVFRDTSIRTLILRVEQYRNLYLELRQDLDDPLEPFMRPSINNIDNIPDVVKTVQKWLSLSSNYIDSETYPDFSILRDRLEQRGIFIFLTSKYKGWSHCNIFRGLTIIDDKMPIIIINDADSKRAQSFTLMHELGHILRNEMNIDSEDNDRQTDDPEIEKWCDHFSGEFLMPSSSSIWNSVDGYELSDIKKMAKRFKVSPHACLVRVHILNKINQTTYNELVKHLNNEYENLRVKRKQSKGGPQRDRVKEISTQFGGAFVHTVLTAWHNQEITLYKVAKLFDLKRPQQVLELDKRE